MKILKNLAITILLCTMSATAQITKGNWMVGGTASFKSYDSKRLDNGSESKYNYTEISPNIGYFFIDKLVIGAKVDVFYYGYEEGVNTKGFVFGPFIKYYFLKTEKRINFFGQANFGYGESTFGQNSNYSTRNYGFKVGPVIYFNSSVGLEMALEYNKQNENGILETNLFQISLGLQIHLKNKQLKI